MKKLISIILLISLLCSACSDTPASAGVGTPTTSMTTSAKPEDPEVTTEVPADEPEMPMYVSVYADEMYDIFVDLDARCRAVFLEFVVDEPDYDPDITYVSDGRTYYKVRDEQFLTWDQWETCVRGIFCGDELQKYLTATYICNVDGYLYCRAGARGWSEPAASVCDMVFTRISATEAEVIKDWFGYVEEDDGIPPEFMRYFLKWVDGKWLISGRERLWNFNARQVDGRWRIGIVN